MTTQTDHERLAQFIEHSAGAYVREHGDGVPWLALADAILAAGWALPKPEAEDREVAEKLALKHHANSKSTLADDVAAALATVRAQMQARVDAMQESVHYANGVADLAMKHRDMAEAALERARATIMFFVSVIKSGEPWTQTCEDAKRAALETPPCK